MGWKRANRKSTRKGSSKRSSRVGRNSDALHEDDGVDPRTFFRRGERPSHHRKTLQLCGQVSRGLSCLLAESGDSALGDLVIDSVQPAPDASRLLVSLMPLWVEQGTSPVELLSILHAHVPRWRSELAVMIHRKRVPELCFQILAREETGLFEALGVEGEDDAG